jgi:hypothetical protein
MKGKGWKEMEVAQNGGVVYTRALVYVCVWQQRKMAQRIRA